MGDFACQPRMNDRPGIRCPVVRTRKLDKIYETAAFRQWEPGRAEPWASQKGTNKLGKSWIRLPPCTREEAAKQRRKVLKDQGDRDWSSGKLRQQGFSRQSTKRELPQRESALGSAEISSSILNHWETIAESCKVNNSPNLHRTGRHSNSIWQSGAISQNPLGSQQRCRKAKLQKQVKVAFK